MCIRDRKAVIMVSHDRFFVDRTTEIIYELVDGKLTRYVGNYTEYKRQKEKQREVQQKKYDAQQKEIARLNELIEKFKHKPKKASMARSKKKVLERMQRVERPVSYTHLRDREQILNSDKVILPGVGAFGDAMEKLRSYGLDLSLIHISWKTKGYFLCE